MDNNQQNGQSFEEQFRASVLNSSMPQQEPHPYRPMPQQPMQYAEQTNPQPKPKWLLPLVAAGVLAIIAIIGLMIIPALVGGSGKEDTVVAANDEVLNEEFAKAVANNEHKDYKTNKEDTVYAEYAPDILSASMDITDEAIASPSSDTRFKKVDAMNSKVLDYYLDEGYVVVMKADRKAGADSTVIYGRTKGQYLAFVGVEAVFEYTMSKAELFNDAVGVPEFYVLKVEI